MHSLSGTANATGKICIYMKKKEIRTLQKMYITIRNINRLIWIHGYFILSLHRIFPLFQAFIASKINEFYPSFSNI